VSPIGKFFRIAHCCHQRRGHYGPDAFNLCELLARDTLGKDALHHGVGAGYPLI